MKGRRLVPYYRANCNGDDRDGCAWTWDGSSSWADARAVAERHAKHYEHEAVVVNLNDGLVLDGRPKR